MTTDPEPPELWRQAMEIGAERVIALPGAEPWLVNALADAVEGPANNAGRVLAVLGARGGAGASVFAVAVGLTALKQARTPCWSTATHEAAAWTWCWAWRPRRAAAGRTWN